MKLLVLLIVVFCGAHADRCHEYVRELTENDVFLSGRKDYATRLLSENEALTAQEFVEKMDDMGKEEGGEKYACGYTRFWIDNIFRGSANQFEELRLSPTGYGSDAGFHDLLKEGRNATKLFQQYASLKNYTVLYKFQTAGALDHVWLVVQTTGPKYRVYQSYNMAYSAHAWVSGDIQGMFSRDPPGFIRYWDDVYDQMEGFVNASGGNITNGQLNMPAGTPNILTEWGQFIIDYDQEQIETNFKKAWEEFGRGYEFSQTDFMAKYVAKLDEMFDKIVPLVGTNSTWTTELDQLWIGLFGSPNPICYPGLPFNFLAQGEVLELQVRIDLLSGDPSEFCEDNYRRIKATIPSGANQTAVVSLLAFVIALYVHQGLQ